MVEFSGTLNHFVIREKTINKETLESALMQNQRVINCSRKAILFEVLGKKCMPGMSVGFTWAQHMKV